MPNAAACSFAQLVDEGTTMQAHVAMGGEEAKPLAHLLSKKKGRKLSLSHLQKCTVCFRVGHLKRNCPQIRCKGCGLLGHFKEDCPAKAEKKDPLEENGGSAGKSELRSGIREDREGWNTVDHEGPADRGRWNAYDGSSSSLLTGTVKGGNPSTFLSYSSKSAQSLPVSPSMTNSTSDSLMYLYEVCYRCGSSRHQQSSCPVPSEVECRQCHQEGHLVTTCPQTRCYNCGAMGHSSQICTSKTHCFHCSVLGHKSSQCPMKHRGRVCYQCKEPGHQAAQCPHGVLCRLCHQEGHIIAHCPSVKCNACHQLGHMAGECKQVTGGVVKGGASRRSSCSSHSSIHELCPPTTTDYPLGNINAHCATISSLASASAPTVTPEKVFFTSASSSLPKQIFIETSPTNTISTPSNHHLKNPEEEIHVSTSDPHLQDRVSTDTNNSSPSAFPYHPCHLSSGVKSEDRSLSCTNSQKSFPHTTSTPNIHTFSAADVLSREEKHSAPSWSTSSTPEGSCDSGPSSSNKSDLQKRNHATERMWATLPEEGGGEKLEDVPSTLASLPVYQPLTSVRRGRVLIVFDGPYFERCIAGHEHKSIEQYKRTTFALQQTLAYLGDLFEMEPIGYWFDTSIASFTEFLETRIPLHCREAAFREFGYRRQYLLAEMNSTTGALHNVVAFLVGFMKRQRGYTPDGPGHVWVQSGVDVAIATCLVEHFQDFPRDFSQVILVSGDSDIYPAVQYCNTLRMQRQRTLPKDSDGAALSPPVRVCGTSRTLSKAYGMNQHLFNFLPRILLNEEIHREHGKTFHFAPHILFQ